MHGPPLLLLLALKQPTSSCPCLFTTATRTSPSTPCPACPAWAGRTGWLTPSRRRALWASTRCARRCRCWRCARALLVLPQPAGCCWSPSLVGGSSSAAIWWPRSCLRRPTALLPAGGHLPQDPGGAQDLHSRGGLQPQRPGPAHHLSPQGQVPRPGGGWALLLPLEPPLPRCHQRWLECCRCCECRRRRRRCCCCCCCSCCCCRCCCIRTCCIRNPRWHHACNTCVCLFLPPTLSLPSGVYGRCPGPLQL